MPAFLLIGIPIVVAVLMWEILSLPDEEIKSEETHAPKKTPQSKKKKQS